MAQNRPPEAEAQDRSSSEEGEGSSEENEDQEASQSEFEEDNTSTPLPKNPPALKKPEPTHISENPLPSSSDESRSESESPNLTRRTDPNIKPIPSQPMEEAPKSTKKRAVESENHSNQASKRAKKKPVGVADSAVEDDDPAAKKTGDDAKKKKKQSFQRLWSEDDEIAILKGLIEYTVKKATDPVTDMNAFYNFIKKSLRVEVSKTQLYYKIRRLKKKYENNVNKGGSKGEEDRILLKPHEQKAYELSQKIWAGVANRVRVSNGKDIVKVNGKARKNQNQIVKEVPRMEVESTKEASRPVFGRRIGKSSSQEEIMKDGLGLISAPQKLELQEKWKQLRLEEAELYLRRLDLVHEQTKLLLEALNCSGH
ncbi:hypothetical protein U1Q18_008977 [Sarracenia purpurea var. burkii]